MSDAKLDSESESDIGGLGELLPLVDAAAQGSTDAARELIERLWPVWRRLLRSSSGLRGPGSEDDVTNIMVRLVEKMTPPEGKALATFSSWQEKNQDKDFGDWIRIVTKNAVRDYFRGESRRLPTSNSEVEEVSPKRVLNEFLRSPSTSGVHVRPPFTAKETARELLEYAGEFLEPAQVKCLGIWLEGGSFDEMAVVMSCDAGEARGILRSGLARLRRQFASA